MRQMYAGIVLKINSFLALLARVSKCKKVLDKVRDKKFE